MVKVVEAAEPPGAKVALEEPVRAKEYVPAAMVSFWPVMVLGIRK
jgi:hypothetical protein